MVRPRQGMRDNDDVVFRLVQMSVAFIDNIIGFEDTPALKIERIGKVLGLGLQV